MAPLDTGARLGPYTILARLGAGGMGEVFRARDGRLQRDVALKVLPDTFSRDANRVARFEREARTVAGLNHPNIVTLHSIEEDGGVHFLIMELVEGQTLDGLMATADLPLEKVLELAIPLADALVAAHGKGVIHRDLKPGNVMVTGDGRIKVLDFGLAKSMDTGSSSELTLATTADSPLSATGQVLGTVPYMAPEQVRGEPLDARTDLFAFGIILYELISGRRPFGGATIADLVSAILRDAPKPLRAVRPDLPADLERIISRCLEKDPADRFQSALDVHRELRLFKRSREGSTLDGAKSEKERPSIAVLPFSNMSADPDNEYFSDGLTEELLNVLAKVPELKVAGRTSSFAFKGRHEDLRDIGQKLGVTTLLEGSVRRAGNRVRITAQLVKSADGFHLWSETYDRVVDDIFALQDDIARAVSAALHVTLLGRSSRAAKGDGEYYELVLRANHLARQSTPQSLSAAVALYREAIEKNPGAARAWAGMANALVLEGFFGHMDSDESHRRAREAAERALALDDELAEAHVIMSMILSSLEFRWEESLAHARRALALAPGASESLTIMAVQLGRSGRLDEGLELLRQAVEIDPLDSHAHLQRSRLQGWARDYEGACRSLRRALELNPERPYVRSALGLHLLMLGRHEEAIAEIEQERAPGYRDYGLAIAHHLAGRAELSDAALERLASHGPAWAFQVAASHAARGEADKAFEWLDRAYETKDTGIGATRNTVWFESLHSDPRWPQFLKKIGMPHQTSV